MSAARILLFLLTALAGIGALYFFSIQVAAAGITLLIAVLLLVGIFFALRTRRR
jgi:hypothetical protein